MILLRFVLFPPTHILIIQRYVCHSKERTTTNGPSAFNRGDRQALNT